MSYLTSDQVIDRVGGTVRAAKLTTESGGTPDATQIATIVNGVESEIDSYLEKRYETPIASTYTKARAVLTGKALDLAAYEIHKLRSPIPDAVNTAHTKALDWLREIAAAKADLPGVPVTGGTGTKGISAQVDGAAKFFHMDGEWPG